MIRRNTAQQMNRGTEEQEWQHSNQIKRVTSGLQDTKLTN